MEPTQKYLLVLIGVAFVCRIITHLQKLWVIYYIDDRKERKRDSYYKLKMHCCYLRMKIGEFEAFLEKLHEPSTRTDVVNIKTTLNDLRKTLKRNSRAVNNFENEHPEWVEAWIVEASQEVKIWKDAKDTKKINDIIHYASVKSGHRQAYVNELAETDIINDAALKKITGQ